MYHNFIFIVNFCSFEKTAKKSVVVSGREAVAVWQLSCDPWKLRTFVRKNKKGFIQQIFLSTLKHIAI